MCLTDYIGIRGECETSTLYLDDLPGIDIVKASNVVSEMHKRPIDLVNKAFVQAQKEVLKDVFSTIDRLYNSLIADDSYTYAGIDSYYGEVAETMKIKINKRIADKFVTLHAFGFELVSDRDITKTFTITTGSGSSETLEVDLVTGLNEITFDKYSNSDFIAIEFDLSDFKIGLKDMDYAYFNGRSFTCRPCHQSIVCATSCTSLELYLNGVQTGRELGFNLCIRCEADECKLIKYFTPTIDLPLLYKTGINYLLEAKMSGRVTAYLRNTEESREELLTYWMGGFDNQKEMKVPSVYWQKVKQVSNSINNLIDKMDSVVFTHNGSFVCNTLP